MSREVGKYSADLSRVMTGLFLIVGQLHNYNNRLNYSFGQIPRNETHSFWDILEPRSGELDRPKKLRRGRGKILGTQFRYGLTSRYVPGLSPTNKS